MQLAIKSFIASIVLVLAGCAISPEMHVSNMLEQTNASMVAGDLDSAHGYIASALSTPGQQAQVTRFFAEKPERRDLYVKIMARHIDAQMSSPTQAAMAREHIDLSQRMAYITSEDAKALSEKLIARAQQGNTIVKVERLRHHERTERPRSEVIRYTRREVSSIFVTRDMPEGSFYSYRLTRSAAFIDYGYEVTVLVNGQVVHNTIVRGTERSESARCTDAVIRRPGGGVRPAEYDANNDMKKRCHSSGLGSLEDLRRRIVPMPFLPRRLLPEFII